VDPVLDPLVLRERVHRAREAVVAEDDRLEVERQVAELADRRPRPGERRVEDLLGAAGVAAAHEVEGRVDEQGDAGERLHRPVVEEQRDPAPLVLLGREHLLGELVVRRVSQ
jgi:hypothetical protein